MNRYARNDSSELFLLQPNIDTAIPLINVIIKYVNGLNGLPTPDLAQFVHHGKGKRGKYRTRYARLRDGCHPDESLRSDWVHEILKKLTNLIYS